MNNSDALDALEQFMIHGGAAFHDVEYKNFINKYGWVLIAAILAAEASYDAGPASPRVLDLDTMNEVKRLVSVANKAAKKYHDTKEIV